MADHQSDIALLRDAFNRQDRDDGEYYVYHHDERYYLILSACDQLKINTIKKSSCILIPIDEWENIIQDTPASFSEPNELAPSEDSTHELPEENAEVDDLHFKLSDEEVALFKSNTLDSEDTTFDPELAAAVGAEGSDMSYDVPQLEPEEEASSFAGSPLMDAVVDGMNYNDEPSENEEAATFWEPEHEAEPENVPHQVIEPSVAWQEEPEPIVEQEPLMLEEDSIIQEQKIAEILPEPDLDPEPEPKPELSLEQKQENSIHLREKSLLAREAALVIREKAVVQQEMAVAEQENTVEMRGQRIIQSKKSFDEKIAVLEARLARAHARKELLNQQEQHFIDVRQQISDCLQKIS